MWKLRVGLQITSHPRVASSKAVPFRAASASALLCASGWIISMCLRDTSSLGFVISQQRALN